MSGPGTELTKLFHSFWVRATPECPCRIVAAIMDHWGPDGFNHTTTPDDIAFMRTMAGDSHTEWLARRCEAVGEDTRMDMVLDCLHEEAVERGLTMAFNRHVMRVLVVRCCNRARRIAREMHTPG